MLEAQGFGRIHSLMRDISVSSPQSQRLVYENYMLGRPPGDMIHDHHPTSPHPTFSEPNFDLDLDQNKSRSSGCTSDFGDKSTVPSSQPSQKSCLSDFALTSINYSYPRWGARVK